MKEVFFGILISILVSQVITENNEDSDEFEHGYGMNAGVFRIGKPFQKVGSKYYYFEHNETLNWHQASSKCISLGAHLVSIKNESEFNAILPHLQPNKHYWIDINDLGTEGDYQSVATGLRATYFKWHSGEPNNGGNNEDCGDLWFDKNKHLMNDRNCLNKINFICEHDT